MASTGILRSSLDLHYDGENLFNAAGLTTLSLGLLHFTIALFRCNFYTWLCKLYWNVYLIACVVYNLRMCVCVCARRWQ